MSQPILRALLALTGINAALTGATLYTATNTTTALLERNYEEAEARMDELEGTLRGHIGLIEESLERIEKSVEKMGGGKSGWGKGMGPRAQELYDQRGRDEKK